MESLRSEDILSDLSANSADRLIAKADRLLNAPAKPQKQVQQEWASLDALLNSGDEFVPTLRRPLTSGHKPSGNKTDQRNNLHSSGQATIARSSDPSITEMLAAMAIKDMKRQAQFGADLGSGQPTAPELTTQYKKVQKELEQRACEVQALQQQMNALQVVLAQHDRETEILEAKVDATTENQGQCIICLSEEPVYALVPCGHLALCGNCAVCPQTRCPICRQQTVSSLRIFKI